MTVLPRGRNLTLMFNLACCAAVRLISERILWPSRKKPILPLLYGRSDPLHGQHWPFLEVSERFVATPSSPRKGVHIGYRTSLHLLATT
jgi:hypothetical protein